MAILYIVATPIGNLEDFSFRASRILKEVDLILCEDTRVTKKLLNYYDIQTPVFSYHQHSKLRKTNYILSLLQQNKNLALVSDAGTPGISDPGNKLIETIIKNPKLAVKIVAIPGPSAVTAAASVSGFPMDRFVFLGFPPTKRKRKKFFEEVAEAKHPIILYESPYRILKTLKELTPLIAGRQTTICRELTKKFETIYRGKIEKVIKNIKENKIKGEFVVIIEGKK